MGLTRRQDVEASGVAVTHYVFDLLRLDGQDTTRPPLRARKSLLRRALTYRAPLRMTPHRNEGGAELLADSCARGWEGLIAKRADGDYQPRQRGCRSMPSRVHSVKSICATSSGLAHRAPA